LPWNEERVKGLLPCTSCPLTLACVRALKRTKWEEGKTSRTWQKPICFATRQTAKTPYKIVAKFVQNRDDSLAMLHLIGDISFDVIGAILTVSLDAALLPKTTRVFSSLFGSNPLFCCLDSQLVFWATMIQSASVVIFRNFNCAMTSAATTPRSTTGLDIFDYYCIKESLSANLLGSFNHLP
jgi:hypothetical protein